MKTRQLYRYLFESNLQAEEIANIPHFFESYKNKPLVAIILSCLKSQSIATIAKELNVSLEAPESLATEDKVTSNFIHQNNLGHFFSEEQLKTNTALYLKAYYVVAMLTEVYGLPQNEAVAKQAYDLVVLYGNEQNPENMFQAFDEYCETIADKSAPFLNRAFAINLPYRTKNMKEINLAAWRKIIHKPSLQENLHLFAIASEIEAKLGHAPNSLEEAKQAASEREFAKKASAPDLATLCAAHCVPEALFDNLLRGDPTPQDALQAILRYLPAVKKLTCLTALPANAIPLEILLAFVDAFPPEDQSKFFAHFAPSIKQFLVNQPIYDVLKIVKGKSGQEKFLASLEPEFIKSKIENIETLKFICTYLHESLHETFLKNTLGKNKINALTTKSNEMLEFMRHCLRSPTQYIDSLRSLFESVKIIDAVVTCSDLCSLNLKSVSLLRFCREILGGQKVFTMLQTQEASLNTLLKALDEKQLSFFFDFLGTEATQKLMPFNRRRALLEDVIPAQRAEFNEKLLTEGEKAARAKLLELKHDIESTTFALGIIGVPKKGGVEITLLDDSGKKSVPTTISDLYAIIKEAKNETKDYETAWNEAQTKCTAAASVSSIHFLTWMSRSDEATKIYDKYKKPEPPAAVLRPAS